MDAALEPVFSLLMHIALVKHHSLASWKTAQRLIFFFNKISAVWKYFMPFSHSLGSGFLVGDNSLEFWKTLHHCLLASVIAVDNSGGTP